MLFWILAIGMTAIACAALYYASVAKGVNVADANAEAAVRAHYRAQLEEIEQDVRAGEMSAEDGETAKAELARELGRQSGESRSADKTRGLGRFAVPVTLAGTVVVAFGVYGLYGHPDMPAQPLSTRSAQIASQMKVSDAIGKVEAHLKQQPDDLRGWQVLAPVYMQQRRFADAAHAFRKVLELSKPTAKAEIDLAEALTMQNGGNPTDEAMNLLESAARRDPTNVRARFYLADLATRAGKYAEAKKRWDEVLALSKGGEAWLPAAQAGLNAVESGLAGKPVANADSGAGMGSGPAAGGLALDPAQKKMVQGMVSGLADRLNSQGGSIDEWTRLVRSYLVLGDRASAQDAYDKAAKAYPDAAERAPLDKLAQGSGLTVSGAKSTAPSAGAGASGGGQASGGDLGLDPAQRKMVQGMVDGLAARLESQGGSIEEWTRLVRSRLVLGDREAAQKAYDAAVAAYPDPAARADLDKMAKSGGLTVK